MNRQLPQRPRIRRRPRVPKTRDRFPRHRNRRIPERYRWLPGHPAEGERVAAFRLEVRVGDDTTAAIRTHHAAPPDRACRGQVAPGQRNPHGDTVTWFGLGAGTVVRPGAHLDVEQADLDPGAAAEA